MSYTIDAIDISTYGMVPGRAPNSNLALSGAWDMPKRIGKTYHDWGDDHGVEAYVEASEIFHEGRDIVFYGLIIGASKTEVTTLSQTFIAAANEWTDLIELACDWGTYMVKINGKVEIEYQGQNVATVKVPFRQPVIDLTLGSDFAEVTLSEGDPTLIGDIDGLDGTLFTSLGLTLLKKGGYLDRADPKSESFIKYGSEGYEITKNEGGVINLQLLLQAADYATFQSLLNNIYKRLALEGVRYLTIDKSYSALTYSIDGAKMTELRVLSGKVLGVLNVGLKNIEHDFAAVGWDILNSEYNNSNLLVSSSVSSLQLSPDGTKLFILFSSFKSLRQYSLSVAYDVTTASYDSEQIILSSILSTPVAVRFSEAGEYVYILGSNTKTIFSFHLLSAWDLSSAIQGGFFDSGLSFPYCMFFKPDGLKMWVGGNAGNIKTYTLSNAWDVTTAVIDTQELSLSGSPFEIHFRPDGLRFYYLGFATKRIYQSDLATPWDITTAGSFTDEFILSNEQSLPAGLEFNFNGLKMYIGGFSGGRIYEYDL